MESDLAYPHAGVTTHHGDSHPGVATIRAVPPFEAPPKLERLLQRMAVAGGITLLGAVWIVPQRAWANFLLASYYVLSLALAGIVFVAIQYVTRAGWSVAFRRVPEAMAGVLPPAALLFVLALFGGHSLYPWFPELHEEGPTLWFKQLWLQPASFYVRSLLYLVAWILLTRAIVRHSRQQDRDGNPQHTQTNSRLSAAFLVVFGFTFWLASFDWLMSLEPHWYSTIFGVYQFAGLILGGLAMMTILAIWLERRGPLRGIFTAEHLHDLGKLLFAFSTFWMYIWFCQYMLIWYANIPEETSYFVHRLEGFWEPLFLLNVLLNWVVPFVVLLHVPAKRSSGRLLEVCWVILVGRWVDLYLTIFPVLEGENPVFGIWEVGIMLGAAGVFFLAVFRILQRTPLVPVKDPFLQESLHYHN